MDLLLIIKLCWTLYAIDDRIVSVAFLNKCLLSHFLSWLVNFLYLRQFAMNPVWQITKSFFNTWFFDGLFFTKKRYLYKENKIRYMLSLSNIETWIIVFLISAVEKYYANLQIEISFYQIWIYWIHKCSVSQIGIE